MRGQHGQSITDNPEQNGKITGRAGRASRHTCAHASLIVRPGSTAKASEPYLVRQVLQFA